MRRIAAGVLIALLSIILPVGVQGQGTFLWQDVVDRGGVDRAVGIVGDKNRVFVVGRTRSVFGSNDWFVRAYQADTGAVLWTDEFDSGSEDRAQALTVDGTRLFVAGWLAHPSGLHTDFAVRAYDAQSGALLWEDRFDYMQRDDFALDISAGGGRVVTIGAGVHAFGHQDILIRAYDAQTGARLWMDAVDSGGDDEGARVIVDKGDVYVTGSVNHAGEIFKPCRILSPPFYSGNCDYWVRAYDAPTGTVKWTDTYDAGDDFDAADGLGVQGGRVVTAGIATPLGNICEPDYQTFSGSGGNCDFLVRTYDAGTGALVWMDRFDAAGGGFDAAGGVATDSSRAYVSGTSAHQGFPICFNPYRDGGNCDYTIRAYAIRDGTLLWEERFDRAGGFDVASGPRVRGGQVILGGRVQINPVMFDYLRWQDCAVRAYDAGTGALVWADQFDMPPAPEGHDRCTVAIAGSKTFAAGRGVNVYGNDDFFVRAYNR